MTQPSLLRKVRRRLVNGVIPLRATRLVGRRTLHERVRANEEAILELRALGGRVSELADLVTELLVARAAHDDPEFKRLVDAYLRDT